MLLFSEDLFHPGYEALPYILDQLPKEKRPKFFTRILAQTTDTYDFTQIMMRWMRSFEQMVFSTADGILIEGPEFANNVQTCNVGKCPLYITGLPFDKYEVRKELARPKKS